MTSPNRPIFVGLVSALCAGCLPSSPVFNAARPGPHSCPDDAARSVRGRAQDEAARAPLAAPPSGTSIGLSLLAAGADEAPEEIVEFYQHEGELKPRPAPRFPGGRIMEMPPPRRRRPRTPMSYHFGVRFGYFAPGEADYDWPAAGYMGLFLRRTPKGPHRLGTEFGGEFVKTDAGGSVFTRMYILHADFLVGRMGARGPSVYAIAGGQVITEEADLYHERDRAAFGGGVEIGAGVGFDAGRGEIEIRAVYTEIMSSGRNTEDSFTIALGYAF